MKLLRLTALISSLLGVVVSVYAQQMDQEDQQAIRSVIAAFPESWNRGDMKAMAQLFGDDADFVVITGKRLVGRAEIEAHHADLQKTAYKDSRLTWSPVKVRFIRPDVAIAHIATEITYREEKRTSFATLVLAKRGRVWLIEALQNTLTGGPGVPRPSPSTPPQ